MTFRELLEKRQSDRKYTNKKVEKEKIQRCLEAARIAPSACNSQPWSFVVIDEDELRSKVAIKTMGPLRTFNNFVSQSPVIIAIVMEKPKIVADLGGRIKEKEFPLIDIGIAAEHICLQAAEDGLGSCMLGWFDEKSVKSLLNIPEKKSIPLLITLGYTPDNYKHRKKTRKKFDNLVKWNSY